MVGGCLLENPGTSGMMSGQLKRVPAMMLEYSQITFLAVLTVFMTSCGGSGEDRPPATGGTDGSVPVGCIQPAFPQDQPDLSLVNPPRFLPLVRPGDPVEAEVTVNAATRRIQVELTDAWSPENVIYTDEVETPGNQTVPLVLSTDAKTGGPRFYMKLTLCGTDCGDQQVIYDANPDINSAYERTLIEDRIRDSAHPVVFFAAAGVGGPHPANNRQFSDLLAVRGGP
jgi:hypothetical protein